MKFEITPNYIKTTKKNFDLLGETMVIMGADLFSLNWNALRLKNLRSGEKSTPKVWLNQKNVVCLHRN